MSNIQSAYQPNRFKAQPAQIKPQQPAAPQQMKAVAPPPVVPPLPPNPKPKPPTGYDDIPGGGASDIKYGPFYQPQGLHNPALVDPGQFSNVSQYRSDASEYLFDSDFEDDDNIYAGLARQQQSPTVSNYFQSMPLDVEQRMLQPISENQNYANQCNLSSAAVHDKNKYPWVASIQNKSTRQHIKTGVLIYSDLILSAYDTVLTDINNILVKIGGVNLDNPDEFVTRNCIGMVKHPDFNVVLLKLNEPVFSIKPIGLNILQSGWNVNGTEIGWGSLSGQPKSKTLFEMNIPLLRPDICKNAFKSKFNENVNICGGFPECGTILPCMGDTGDPLIVNVNNEMLLEGVSEYHINCELKLGLASWVKTSALNNWIQRNAALSPPSQPQLPSTLPPPPGTSPPTIIYTTQPPTTTTNGTVYPPNTIILSTAPPPPTRTSTRFSSTTRATVPLTSKGSTTRASTQSPSPTCATPTSGSGSSGHMVILVVVFLLVLALFALTKL